MVLSHRVERRICILTIKGELDTAGVTKTRDYIHSMLENETLDGLVFDLKHVELIKTIGLGLAVSTLKILKQENKKFALCGLNFKHIEIFRLTKLDEVFDIYSTAERAVEAMQGNENSQK